MRKYQVLIMHTQSETGLPSTRDSCLQKMQEKMKNGERTSKIIKWPFFSKQVPQTSIFVFTITISLIVCCVIFKLNHICNNIMRKMRLSRRLTLSILNLHSFYFRICFFYGQYMQQNNNNKMNISPKRKFGIDFSNIFSPESQSYLKSKRSKSKGSNDQSKYHSTLSKGRKDVVANIPNITAFRATHKISLNNAKAVKMSEKLQVEAEAQQKFTQRAKRKDFYLNYSYNPLTSNPQSSSHNASTEAHHQTKNHLMDQYDKLQSKPDDHKFKSKLNQISKNIQLNQRSQQQVVNNLRPKQKKFAKRQQQERNIQTMIAVQQSIQSQLQLFDRLINTKEEKFVIKRDQTNIFSLLFRTNKVYFQPNQILLSQHQFSVDSMALSVDRQSKRYKANPLLQISTFNRQIIRGVMGKDMPQRLILRPGDINISLERLSFKDMIVVASAKLQSQVLATYLREAEAPSQKKTIQTGKSNKVDRSADQMKNTAQKLVNSQMMDQNTINLMYSAAQEVQIEKVQTTISKSYIQKLKHLLKEQNKIILNSIKDRKFRKKIQLQKNEILIKQLESNADPRLNKLMNELERKIRMSKKDKSKTQKIKIDLLCQSLQLTKSIERGLRKSPQTNRRRRP